MVKLRQSGAQFWCKGQSANLNRTWSQLPGNRSVGDTVVFENKRIPRPVWDRYQHPISDTVHLNFETFYPEILITVKLHHTYMIFFFLKKLKSHSHLTLKLSTSRHFTWITDYCLTLHCKYMIFFFLQMNWTKNEPYPLSAFFRLRNYEISIIF